MVSLLSKAAIVAVAAIHFVIPLASAEGEWLMFLQDCPQTCSSSGVSSGNWTAYHNTKPLTRCKEPMLLDLAIHKPINDLTKSLSLFACSGLVTGDDSTCQLGSESVAEVQSAWSGSKNGVDGTAVIQAAEHAVSHLSKADCASTNPTTTFGYLNGSFVGVYSGGMMHNQGAMGLIQQFINGIEKDGPQGDFQVMQICGSNRTADYVVGIAASIPTTPGDISALAAVQNAVLTWSNAKCVSGFDSSSTANTKVWEQKTVELPARGELAARADCTTARVVSGDSCASLATKCGISAADFTKYNPSSTLCSTLSVGEYVCCSSGTLPDLKPKPNPDGSCFSYTVQTGDYCSLIASSFGLTVDDLTDFNDKTTWGWSGCEDIQPLTNICLSTGDPPLPYPLAGNVCGPSVPGTVKPTNGTALSDLNPCLLNACCDKWGQCGVDATFCTDTKGPTGNPGTSPTGTNGCISNCGTDIVKGDAPSTFISLGYFESFNSQRACLNMDVRSLAGYTWNVIHFAFAQITDDFDVDISTVEDSFNYFKGMTGFKKIISFGGWSFSTSLDSYGIFRSGVTPAQRQTFANNVAAFIKNNGLDGVDFDWEYPGAPDIKGIPPGSPTDGPNYLDFIKTLKPLMPSGTTVSIAAPASYWYLKGFPIKEMSEVLDYIVYMTYDLHGQWDYDNAFSNPGCENGNCLRSHINSTETDLALSMITKAGVNSGKIVVGVASYGRSFQMTDPSCTGPSCLFSGPESGATPGECTATAGYISNAELNDIIGMASSSKRDDASAVKTWHDDDSDSDIVTYGSNWVAYMSDDTMAKRVSAYKGNNFAGSTNWAVDLANFVTAYDSSNPDSNDIDWQHIQCNSLDTDINLSGPEIWNKLGCDDAWAAGIAYWNTSGHQVHEFSEELAQFFNATSLKSTMDCDSLNTDNGCGDGSVSCGNGVSPAGYVILNSMINLDAEYWQLYTAVLDASQDAWDDAANIASTFDPPPGEDKTAEAILEILENVWTMGIAPGLGNLFKKAFGEGEETEAFDKLKDAADIGFSKIQDTLSADNPIDPTAELQDQLKAMSDLWLLGLEAIGNATFDGSGVAIDTLYGLIAEGSFYIKSNPGAYEMRQYAELPMYAKLIPLAWSYDNGDLLHNPSGIVVVDSATACNAGDACPSQVPGFPSGGLSEYLTTDAAQKTCHCYDGNMYYLVQAYGGAENCVAAPVEHCDPNLFTTPPGLDSLDGTKWGGLTLATFVEGSVNTYKANNNANGYKLDFKDPATIRAFATANILAPGGISIPVCSAAEAYSHWDSLEHGGSKNANYPCD